MYNIVNSDEVFGSECIADGATRLFALLRTEGENNFKIVSQPAFCREGFSVLVSQLVHRKMSSLRYEYVYGHEILPSEIYTDELVGGKVPLTKDGRFYFGVLVGGRHKITEEGLRRYAALQHVRRAGIKIDKASSPMLPGDCTTTVFVVSVPAVFTTNTWTMSLVTGVVREIILPSAQDFVTRLTPKVVDVLFQYVQDCAPQKYMNLASFQWSRSFGVQFLWHGVRGVTSVYNPRMWKHDHTLEDAVRRYYYLKTKSAVREIANLIRYLKDTERYDILPGLSNLPS